jgi:hypothetical protein
MDLDMDVHTCTRDSIIVQSIVASNVDPASLVEFPIAIVPNVYSGGASTSVSVNNEPVRWTSTLAITMKCSVCSRDIVATTCDSELDDMELEISDGEFTQGGAFTCCTETHSLVANVLGQPPTTISLPQSCATTPHRRCQLKWTSVVFDGHCLWFNAIGVNGNPGGTTTVTYHTDASEDSNPTEHIVVVNADNLVCADTIAAITHECNINKHLQTSIALLRLVSDDVRTRTARAISDIAGPRRQPVDQLYA